MLEIFETYNDILLEIDIIQEQIKLTENGLKYWFGIKLNPDVRSAGIPFAAPGTHRFGAIAGLNQADKTIESLNGLNERLEQLERAKKRIDYLVNQFEGIEYKIMYKRYVERKTLNEIADELGYSHDRIRHIHANLKKDSTLTTHTD
jgi:hypothetical protein